MLASFYSDSTNHYCCGDRCCGRLRPYFEQYQHFNDKYVTITCGLFVLLEIALFVIYKLIEED